MIDTERKIYAVYERDFSRKWSLAIYYDDKPTKNVSYNPERSTIYVVTMAERREDGTVDLEKVAAAFPAPVDPVETEPGVSIPTDHSNG